MSLSDCTECWDTPCTCGWNYRNYSIKILEKRKELFEKIIEFKNKYPNAKFSEGFVLNSKETEDDKKFVKFMNEFLRKESIK